MRDLRGARANVQPPSDPCSRPGVPCLPFPSAGPARGRLFRLAASGDVALTAACLFESPEAGGSNPIALAGGSLPEDRRDPGILFHPAPGQQFAVQTDEVAEADSF